MPILAYHARGTVPAPGDDVDVPGPECDCGMGNADPAFLSRLDRDWVKSRKCRQCKVFLFLHEAFEVDKYCYRHNWFSRRRMFLGLSKDNRNILFWPQHWGPAWESHATKVPLEQVAGVVFGTYTSTFKRLSSSDTPPRWSAFSLVCQDRTYDFSARLPDAVECYVTGFQELIWQNQRRSGPLAAPSTPWPTGFFLWMRLRLRLQEAAWKAKVRARHQLWVVFVQCATRCSDPYTKHRFLDMAMKLQRIFRMDPTTVSAGMRRMAMTLNFQRERVREILEDRYGFDDSLTCLPKTPPVITGGRMRKQSSFSLKVLSRSSALAAP